ncbi:SIMPL domain-containing protein [Gilvimarinus sp. F26214L]|uniref:SIMPL domain-containing protein n=1 Tax=Gilvimarinus sp. DZF01 TaxID=3461371 RepID=UPI0040454F6E
MNSPSSFIVGVSLVVAAGLLGFLGGEAAQSVKEYERSVTVKGLAEREVPADVVIWPILFTEAGNDLNELYSAIERGSANIRDFLLDKGMRENEITFSSPSIVDKSAQQYGGSQGAEFRYAATQTVTVYSSRVDQARAIMSELSELGKQGLVLNSEDYRSQVEYVYTGLNDIKPAMIEEATRNAREVATKFAMDSDSRLGKIKRASQGQFSISPRDKNNPHIKNVRVVSTIEYYLSD